MREPLSARGRDRDLIRPSVCGDQGATVNQRQTDPLSPWGFTRLDPDTLSPCHTGTRTHTHAHCNSHKSTFTPPLGFYTRYTLLHFTVDYCFGFNLKFYRPNQRQCNLFPCNKIEAAFLGQSLRDPGVPPNHVQKHHNFILYSRGERRFSK